MNYTLAFITSKKNLHRPKTDVICVWDTLAFDSSPEDVRLKISVVLESDKPGFKNHRTSFIVS